MYSVNHMHTFTSTYRTHTIAWSCIRFHFVKALRSAARLRSTHIYDDFIMAFFPATYNQYNMAEVCYSRLTIPPRNYWWMHARPKPQHIKISSSQFTARRKLELRLIRIFQLLLYDLIELLLDVSCEITIFTLTPESMEWVSFISFLLLFGSASISEP